MSANVNVLDRLFKASKDSLKPVCSQLVRTSVNRDSLIMYILEARMNGKPRRDWEGYTLMSDGMVKRT